MTPRTKSYRLLIYSHDTFGLGHLRRCRAIAHDLVGHRDDLSVLIISGSPLIGAYDFKSRVDFVRVPGVMKLRNGKYTSRGLDISIEDAIQIRRALIQCSAESFRPHVFLVDKEPLGLRGEVEPTLHHLRQQGARLVLGLRDIMDDHQQLAEEWDRKDVMPALDELYDDVWVYGCRDIYDPLTGLDVPASVRRKMTYTGYLHRDSELKADPPAGALPDRPFILVTPGGGGDGAELVDWVISAYERDRSLPVGALIVLGPFMPGERKEEFNRRAESLGDVRVVSFLPGLTAVMERSVAVVAMGGYNTFCEILTADRPALIVPRTVPRREQLIRAERMSAIGLVQMLIDDGVRDPSAMARALRRLPLVPPPSAAPVRSPLEGFARIRAEIDAWLPGESVTSRVPELSH
jgi:predicted glycosyltransferase